MKTTQTRKPRLVHLTIDSDGRTEKIGYLELSDDSRVVLGKVSSPQYRLVQSLFNPANSKDIRFQPLKQTPERTYTHMYDVDLPPGLHSRMSEVIESRIARAISSLKRSEAGKYLTFTQSDRYLQMDILPA